MLNFCSIEHEFLNRCFSNAVTRFCQKTLIFVDNIITRIFVDNFCTLTFMTLSCWLKVYFDFFLETSMLSMTLRLKTLENENRNDCWKVKTASSKIIDVSNSISVEVVSIVLLINIFDCFFVCFFVCFSFAFVISCAINSSNISKSSSTSTSKLSKNSCLIAISSISFSTSTSTSTLTSSIVKKSSIVTAWIFVIITSTNKKCNVVSRFKT